MYHAASALASGLQKGKESGIDLTLAHSRWLMGFCHTAKSPFSITFFQHNFLALSSMESCSFFKSSCVLSHPLQCRFHPTGGPDSVSATWKAGPTPRKSEAVTHHLNPILHRLLNAKLFMGNISKPSKISALRPFERDLVVGRRRDKAPEELLLGRAVPFPPPGNHHERWLGNPPEHHTGSRPGKYSDDHHGKLAGSRHAQNSDSHYGRLVDFEAPGPNHFVPVNSPAVAGSLLPPSLGLGPECRQDFRERQIEIGSPIPLGRYSFVYLVCY
nr:Os06g0103950 [Ipomoea batatas]